MTELDPYLLGSYSPIHSEITAENLRVDGSLPADLSGFFVRNGSNPRFAPKGRYHWFDGDGMLHGIHFEDGKATYRNRYVRAPGFLQEEAAGDSLWTGIMEPPDLKSPRGPFKNTGNTDVVFSGDQLLALWWMCGEAYIIKLPTLETIGTKKDPEGKPLLLTAHPKVDPRTKEVMVIEFGVKPPFLHYMVLSKDGALVHRVPVPLAGPRLQHDIAITDNYTILMDLPMYNDPEMMKMSKTRVRFYRDRPSRFGLIPRFGDASQIKWFEASPCYIYHTINAWEEGDEVVMLGCKIENPLAKDPSNPARGTMIPTLGVLRLEPIFYCWRFNLKTGQTKEEQLDDVLSEFPRMDNRALGQKSRYSYHPKIASAETLSFDGFIKYDAEKKTSVTHHYPAGYLGGEVCFAPRVNAKSEDDGYLLTFTSEIGSGASEMYVVDAQNVDAGPVARVHIPQRVPAGYHSWWVSQEELQRQKMA